MEVPSGFTINVTFLTLEFILVLDLFLYWYGERLSDHKANFMVEPRITKFHVEDPNKDVFDAVKYFEMRAAAILPLIAALVAVSVVFSMKIVSYFTLFPLMVAFFAYYFTFSKSPHAFYPLAPRSELAELAYLSDNKRSLIKRDRYFRKKILRAYYRKHCSLVIGHVSFVAAVLTFIVGSILNNISSYPGTTRIFVMGHTMLLSYIGVLLIELASSWHKSESQSFSLTIPRQEDSD
jgi:hypothetical protein